MLTGREFRSGKAHRHDDGGADSGGQCWGRNRAGLVSEPDDVRDTRMMAEACHYRSASGGGNPWISGRAERIANMVCQECERMGLIDQVIEMPGRRCDC